MFKHKLNSADIGKCMSSKDTQFKEGNNANPGGRPKSQYAKFKHLLKGRDDVIINQIISLAVHGDKDMLKFMGERVMPAPNKTNPVDIDLQNKTLVERADEVYKAMSEQRISPSEAYSIMASLSTHVQIEQATAIMDRLKALEEGMKK
jgi:hypothetical protein